MNPLWIIVLEILLLGYLVLRIMGQLDGIIRYINKLEADKQEKELEKELERGEN